MTTNYNQLLAKINEEIASLEVDSAFSTSPTRDRKNAADMKRLCKFQAQLETHHPFTYLDEAISLHEKTICKVCKVTFPCQAFLDQERQYTNPATIADTINMLRSEGL